MKIGWGSITAGKIVTGSITADRIGENRLRPRVTMGTTPLSEARVGDVWIGPDGMAHYDGSRWVFDAVRTTPKPLPPVEIQTSTASSFDALGPPVYRPDPTL